jgi:hypothetical protein
MNPTKGQTMTTTNPVFSFLFAKYKALHEQGLDDTVEARQLFGEMMVYAPPEYKEAAHELAVKMGLMPDKPDGYSDDGEPLYSLDAMCERMRTIEAETTNEAALITRDQPAPVVTAGNYEPVRFQRHETRHPFSAGGIGARRSC